MVGSKDMHLIVGSEDNYLTVSSKDIILIIKRIHIKNLMKLEELKLAIL